ncbi:Odorant receptor 92a [Culex quinquefasciatus]|uniref:Odorant receptor n=1 Tax=Culex quinquefasciatus TaxID=7176 RepID=B0WN07_CULQU|nr:Odorant receptor 92a [Culex quinquefasciatus]|eukprot:XP_001850091.1 Odorant receptor 92a [Culex quinquefasciatus]
MAPVKRYASKQCLDGTPTDAEMYGTRTAFVLARKGGLLIPKLNGPPPPRTISTPPPARMATLPNLLQVMPSTLRLMELTGLWGSPKLIHRFVLMYCYGLLVMLLPRFVFGVGSEDVSAIIKSLAEVIFLVSIFVPTLIFAAKLRGLERVVRGLGDIFREASNDDQSSECYDLIVKQNVKIEKFFNFLTIYMKFAAFGYCLPSIMITYWRYFTNDGTSPVIFILPMEQEFYGLQIRTNLVHYHIFMVFSLLAYMVCSYFTLVKLTLPLFMLRYSSMTYRLVAVRIRNLSVPEMTADDLKKVIELHRKAFEVTELIEEMCHIPVALEFLTCVLLWCLVMFYTSTTMGYDLFSILIVVLSSLVEAFGYAYLGSELSEQAEKVGVACYDLPWYVNCSKELKGAFQLMIQRSQKINNSITIPSVK